MATHAFLQTRVLRIEEYREEMRRLPLSQGERIQRYGTTNAPIPIPLSIGETVEMYEQRFHRWLAKLRVRVSELKHDVQRERSLWCNFARLNAKGKLPANCLYQHVTRLRIQERLGDPIRRPGIQEDSSSSAFAFPQECSALIPTASATLEASIAAYTDCGCRSCITQCVTRMTVSIAGIEDVLQRKQQHIPVEARTPRPPCPPPPTQPPTRIIESPKTSTKRVFALDVSSIGHASKRARLLERAPSTQSPQPISLALEDPIETRLISQYDILNERVLANERTAAPDEQTTATQHGTSLLTSESDTRNAALSIAIVYLYRKDQEELEKIVDISNECDWREPVRNCHKECADIAAQLKATQLALTETKAQLHHHATQSLTQLDDHRVRQLTELGERQRRYERELVRLRHTRRQTFTTIARVDALVRQLIRTVLAMGTVRT
ncbi:hypothetical protein Poli38472_005915 [Pythium oligandrum]|uniref:Uncharacterized protein n=1 Tax=Pythium oligandrum TaxID=41045 RepID=A0A8K1FQZ4_PYTOL|nr:hypothetical protein Poli38472_005915 [Pythium oligandrum]|eukprot:TMW68447.1 hypothetical protein Poli38472_005915 [Pythium oligandrum]